MSQIVNNSRIGAITSIDLTVPDAVQVRDFYQQVTGWTSSEIDVGGYNNYNMHRPTDGHVVAGVCHARGATADLPAQWLIYITVDDLDRSLVRCVALGGQVLAGPNDLGEEARYSVIQDPAGAVCALFQPVSSVEA